MLDAVPGDGTNLVALLAPACSAAARPAGAPQSPQLQALSCRVTHLVAQLREVLTWVAEGSDQESMIAEASELEWRRDLLTKALETLNERERHILTGRGGRASAGLGVLRNASAKEPVPSPGASPIVATTR